MKDEDYQELQGLVHRGNDIIEKVAQLKGNPSLVKILDFAGKILTGQLDVENRDFGHTIREGAIDLASSPILSLKQEYQDWQIECRGFFAQMGWESNKLVRLFLEIGSAKISRETSITVEMLVGKQQKILEQLADAPPKSWHFTRAGFVVIYIAFCIFVDVILFAFIELATIPVAAFQVALLVAFPKIEDWIKNY